MKEDKGFKAEHTPLTAQEIEELKGRHPATETPRTCPHCEDSVGSGLHSCGCGHIGVRDSYTYVEALERDYHDLRDALPRLLSMLTPAPDAGYVKALEAVADGVADYRKEATEGCDSGARHRAWLKMVKAHIALDNIKAKDVV